MAKCVAGHSVAIYDRGGRKRVGPLLDLSRVQWERARDDTSEAFVRMEADSCSRQADFLASIRSRRHEMVIYRGRDRVWEGPIHRIGLHGRYAEIAARDVTEYLNKTPVTRVWDNTSTGAGPTEMTARMYAIIQHELNASRVQLDASGASVLVPAWESLDPPVNILPHLVRHAFPNEARTTARTLPFQDTVGGLLENAARTGGIDFTAIGRAIHLWDVSRNLGKITTLTEANFYSDVIVTEYGSDHAQSAYVIGQDGVYGSAVNPQHLDYYGPWTTVFTAYNEEGSNDPTESELRSQAFRNLAGRSPVPIEVRVPDNSGIVLTDNLSINQLVPGVQVPVRATLNARNVSQLQKIDHVKVIEDGRGESVQVTLTPATRADSDEVTP